MTAHPLHFAALTFALGVFASCNVEAQTYTLQEVLIARTAVNEGSFREADIAAVAYARMLYTPDELRAAHRRALAVGRTDPRRWIEGLSDSMERPAGWPEHLVPWETRGRVGWARTLEIVHDVVRGRVVPCNERPSTWGGRRVDAARIARMTANGWRVVTCGATGNLFLRRAS